MDAGGCFGEMNPGSQQSCRARGRVIAFNERSSLFDMQIFHYLADGQNRRAEIIQLAQSVPNFLASFAACPGSDYLLQFGAVLAARGWQSQNGDLGVRSLRPIRCATCAQTESLMSGTRKVK